MAEAAMMAVADVVGRAGAHELVYEASSIARAEGISLREALDRSLGPELLAQLPPLDAVLDPSAYLGEADAIVTAALAGWARVTVPDSPEAETARR
jgi:adenylosuccinate lyase